MSDLVRLLNVFCLLSLLAVGGGSAVLPEMQHETVAVHHWVTDQQFATIYSLGQMAPGPNMSMVARQARLPKPYLLTPWTRGR